MISKYIHEMSGAMDYNENIQHLSEISHQFRSSSSLSSDNFTRHWHLEDDQITSWGMTFLYIICFIIVIFVGCPLSLSIVHFEHFGGDPQKRRLSNMILTNICIFMIFHVTIWYFMLGLRVIFGPLYHTLAAILFSIHTFTLLCLDLSGIFGIVLKNIEMISPRTVLLFNDDFWYSLLTLITMLVSFVVDILLLMDEEWLPYFYGYVGKSSQIHFTLSIINTQRYLSSTLPNCYSKT